MTFILRIIEVLKDGEAWPKHMLNSFKLSKIGWWVEGGGSVSQTHIPRTHNMVSGDPLKLNCLYFSLTPFLGRQGSEATLPRVVNLKWTVLLDGLGDCGGEEKRTAGELTFIWEQSILAVLGRLCVDSAMKPVSNWLLKYSAHLVDNSRSSSSDADSTLPRVGGGRFGGDLINAYMCII